MNEHRLETGRVETCMGCEALCVLDDFGRCPVCAAYARGYSDAIRPEVMAAQIAALYEEPAAIAHTLQFLARGTDCLVAVANTDGVNSHSSFRIKTPVGFSRVIWSTLTILRNNLTLRSRLACCRALLGKRIPTL